MIRNKREISPPMSPRRQSVWKKYWERSWLGETGPGPHKLSCSASAKCGYRGADYETCSLFLVGNRFGHDACEHGCNCAVVTISDPVAGRLCAHGKKGKARHQVREQDIRQR